MALVNGSPEAPEINEGAPEAGTKRRADSLFLHEDEELAKHDAEGTKRIKSEKAEEPILASVAPTATPAPRSPPASTEPWRLGDDLLTGLDFDEDSRQVLPYKPLASAAKGRLAVHHPSFKEAEIMLLEIGNTMLHAVETAKDSGFESSEINNICDELRHSLNLPHRYPSIAPVALVGEAGIGKSSFISCLLGIRGIAPQTDSAKRGTYVVHEYIAARSRQTALYEVEAWYFSWDQIFERAYKYARVIRECHMPTTEYDEGEMLKLRDTALTFFHTLLCEHDEFATPNLVSEYFRETLQTKLELVAGELTQQIEDFKLGRAIEGVETHTARDNAELTQIFAAVSRAPATTALRGAHPWPILRKVQVRYDDDLLSSGVILADLPGISDSNSAIVEGSMDALRNAGTVLVFSRIDRVEDNHDLDDILRECIAAHKTSDTSLVLTKIDIKDRLQPEERDELAPSELEKLVAAENLAQKLRAEQANLARDLKVAKRERDSMRYMALKADEEDLPAKIACADARIDQFGIEWRNRSTIQRMQNKFRTLTRSDFEPDLPVYFVSSSQYRMHLEGYEATKPPCLDVAATGVENVKDRLYEIPSRGKTTTLRRIALSAVPNHLLGISCVLTKSPLARKGDVVELITTVLSKRAQILETLKRDLRKLFQLHIDLLFKTHSEAWQRQTSGLIEVWGKCRPQTFLAFCRRGGHWHLTTKVPDISWNGQIQSMISKEARPAFDALRTDVQSTHTNAEANLEDIFQQVEVELRECKDFQGSIATAEPFFKTVRLIVKQVHQRMKTVCHQLAKKIKSILTHTTVMDNEFDLSGSNIYLALKDTYDDCLSLELEPGAPSQGRKGNKGKAKSGLHAGRVKMLGDKLSGGNGVTSVFTSLHELIEEVYERSLATWEETFEQVLNDGANAVIESFDRTFQIPDINIEEHTEATDLLRAAAEEMLSRCEGPLKEKIEEFQAYERTASASK